MAVYEIVYETGNHSLAEYESDEEALAALNAHQERAKNGEAGAEGAAWPAERIAKVYKFESHPANYGVGQQVLASDLVESIEGMKDADGLVNAPEAAAAVRASSSPLVTPENPHDSMYAMEHTELEWENN